LRRETQGQAKTRAGADGSLPESFAALLERCQSHGLTVRAVKVGGAVLNLGTESGLLNFCRARLSKIQNSKFKIQNSNAISEDSRLVGKVLLGKNVQTGAKVIVVGPSIIGNNVTIEQGAVIDSSIIGPDVCVPKNQLVRNRILTAENAELAEKKLTRQTNGGLRLESSAVSANSAVKKGQCTNDVFVSWPRFSYAGSIKRIVDFFAAIIMLILFAPVLPFIALAIKLTSPGPVFFKDKRQGLRGKEFYCLKFRTMTVGAEKIQDKLRNASLVDGPQFKMADDPRVSSVGKFLRDTYIDEIPQFLNVLLGQMSVVGPRPSPESENTFCPSWRDARLSVRPGITGLWQVCRTRQPMKDFQEWIYYDTKYVRNLSLKTDLWICWQTIKKLGNNFINQF
jgi:lipopolysaccharide/colanic/teichoic acid biosynthesis glycosyltransferase